MDICGYLWIFVLWIFVGIASSLFYLLMPGVEEGIAWDSEAEAEGVGELPAGLAAPLVELVLAPMVPLADAGGKF